jgi:hypothetical protein
MFPGKYQSDFAVQVTSHINGAEQYTINFTNNNLLGSGQLPTYRTSKARVCVTVGAALPVSEVQLVDHHAVGCLHVVSIGLEVHGDSIPPGGHRSGFVVPIDHGSRSVEVDGLEQEPIVRSSLHPNGRMVPGIAQRMAGNAGRNPGGVQIVPNVPLVPPRDPALSSPDEAHAVEILINIELECLRQLEVPAETPVLDCPQTGLGVRHTHAVP